MKILGLADIVVDGVTLLSQADAVLEPGGVNRVTRKGNTVHGYSEEVMESKLEVTVSVDSGYSIDFFRNITNATIAMNADTGQIWMVRGGWCALPPTVTQKDGTSKATFNGPPAEEIL